MKFLLLPLFILLFCKCEMKKNIDSKVEYLSLNKAGEIETILKEETHITGDIVIIPKNSIFFLKNNNLFFNANKIVFEENVKIFGYKEDDFADCEENGKNSGSLFLNSNEIVGNPYLYLKGENSGKFGLGYSLRLNNNEFYTEIDREYHRIRKKDFIPNDCKKTQTPMGDLRLFNDYWTVTLLSGGDSGNIYLKKNSIIEEFNPTVNYTTSKGHPKSYVYYFIRKSHSKETHTQSGKSGNSTQICEYIDGLSNCN